MKPSTFFTLMAEFGTGQIPVTEVGKKYFGYDESKAKQVAARGQYPFPVFRSGGQKSPWLVDAAELANYLDKAMEKAKKEWSDAH